MNKGFKKIVLYGLVPLAIIVSVFTLPLFAILIDTSSLLTVVSLVFAVLVGFFIATATTNYINFQRCLAQETANLIVIFNLGNIVKPSEKEKITEKIDQYVIATLDFSLTEYVEETYLEFKQVVESIDELQSENDTKRGVVALDHLQATKIDLIRNRESVALSALRITSGLHWLILVFLAATLVFLLFSLRTDGPLLNIVIGALSSAVYFTLLLLYEVDGNIFLEEQLAYQDVQRIFKTIGRLPYYPPLAFKSGMVKRPKESYRLGVYTDYPRSRVKEIKIYNQNQKSNLN